MLDCLDGRGGEVTARAGAAELGRSYLALNAAGRERFLRLLAEEFDTDHDAVIERCAAVLATPPIPASALAAERALRAALTPPRVTLLRQFNALARRGEVPRRPARRADRASPASDPALRGLADDLRDLLANWFDIGFLELRRITWESPAALLEKADGLRGRARDPRLDRPEKPARSRPPLLCLFSSAHARRAADLCRGGAGLGDRRQHPCAARRGGADRQPADRRRGDLLFDLELPEGAGRDQLRRFPDQAGRRCA